MKKKFNKPIIFLDFDNTLLNTVSFRGELFNFIARWGIPSDTITSTYLNKKNWEDDYSIINHLLEIEKKIKQLLPKEKIWDAVKNNYADLRRFVFPDVVPWLTQMKDDGYDLCILSYSNADFQNFKLRAAHLDQYFTHKIYTWSRGTKGATAFEYTKNSQIVFIDDDPFELNNALRTLPHAKLYQMSRYGDPPKSSHALITSLLDLQIP